MKTITIGGNTVKLAGELPEVGQKAPVFEAVKGDLSVASLSDYGGKRIVLNIFPSLDTQVCAASVRRFNKEAASLKNTVVLCISKDLPFAQSRFCTTEGLEGVVALSTFNNKSFDEAYGLLITEGGLKGLYGRAVIVLDENGTILYEELVPELTTEPNYDAALAPIK